MKWSTILNPTLSLLCLLGGSVLMTSPVAFSAGPSYGMPEQVDPAQTYVFFLHNYYVETKGPNGDCRYQDILQAFSGRGFRVISEVRTGKIIPCTYAEKIVRQVKILLDSGVPPGNIVVAGHSKGAVIALCASAQLGSSDINFVIMAGCNIPGILKYKLYPDASALRGRILSIYAKSDTVAGSCKEAFSAASQGLLPLEILIDSDAGHRLFFTPDPAWLAPVAEWISKKE